MKTQTQNVKTQTQDGWLVIAWEDVTGYQDIYVMVKETKPLAIASIKNIQIEFGKEDMYYEIKVIGKTYPIRMVLKALKFRWNGVEWYYRSKDEAEAFDKFFEVSATLMKIL